MIWIFFIFCFAIAYKDIKDRIIPDELIFIGIFFALIFNSFGMLGFKNAFMGMILGWTLLFIAGLLNFFSFKNPGIGGGDVKLMALIGAFWGWQMALMTFAIAPFLGAFYCAVFNKTKCAYSIFLISACLIALILKGVQ